MLCFGRHEWAQMSLDKVPLKIMRWQCWVRCCTNALTSRSEGTMTVCFQQQGFFFVF